VATGQGRSHFQQELRALEQQALGGLDLVVVTLDRTLEALRHQDIELASIVVHDDDRIDGRYLEVQQGILSLLALQAPVASDLRLVAALLHVIKHVERMGDQCVNIAKMLPVVGYEPPSDERMLEQIHRMGAIARSLIAQAKQVDDARRAGARADRRQRRGHRRAGGVRGHGAVPGVLGRFSCLPVGPRRAFSPPLSRRIPFPGCEQAVIRGVDTLFGAVRPYTLRAR
jgi:hypothetical protein